MIYLSQPVQAPCLSFFHVCTNADEEAAALRAAENSFSEVLILMPGFYKRLCNTSAIISFN
jgi:hypothetical protein